MKTTKVSPLPSRGIVCFSAALCLALLLGSQGGCDDGPTDGGSTQAEALTPAERNQRRRDCATFCAIEQKYRCSEPPKDCAAWCAEEDGCVDYAPVIACQTKNDANGFGCARITSEISCGSPNDPSCAPRSSFEAGPACSIAFKTAQAQRSSCVSEKPVGVVAYTPPASGP